MKAQKQSTSKSSKFQAQFAIMQLLQKLYPQFVFCASGKDNGKQHGYRIILKDCDPSKVGDLSQSSIVEHCDKEGNRSFGLTVLSTDSLDEVMSWLTDY